MEFKSLYNKYYQLLLCKVIYKSFQNTYINDCLLREY